NLHAVAPDLPSETPSPERGAFPVVLDEADVMFFALDTDRLDRVEIEILQIIRRGLEDDLKLVIVLQTVGIFSITSVLGAARGLNESGTPRFRPQRAKRGGGVKRPCPDLHVIGLQDHAALLRPVMLQRENQILKGVLRIESGRHGEPRKRLATLYGRPPA